MAYVIPGAATDLETLQNAAGATGNGNTLETIGHSVCAFQVTGTFTATVTFEGTADGTNYVSLEVVNAATGAKSTTATAAGVFRADCSGLQRVRARVSAYTSGTVTVKGRALPIPSGILTADIDATGATITAGDNKTEDAAHSTGDTGSFILGVRNDTASTTFADANGDYTPIAVNSAGEVFIAEFPAAAALADTASAPTTTAIASHLKLRSGSTWDDGRGVFTSTILSSAARTATNNSSDQTNFNGRGAHVVIDVTASGGVFSITPTIEGKDVLSGKYYTILAGSAITGTGTTVLKVYPGITASANAAASDVLPRTWRVTMTHLDATSVTYSVGSATVV